MSDSSPFSAVSSIATGTASASAANPKLHEAAQQFEAVMLRQMMAEAHKAKLGDTLFSSSAGDTFNDMADARFADIASKSDTMGLAKMLEAQITRQVGVPATTGSPTGKGG